ncbi:MAG: class A beta-lactamase, subclass A2 [Saprospiraceae bacterium]|nr:class A beta-lactamase, subclass A2 [Saprospiraceae bacterium]
MFKPFHLLIILIWLFGCKNNTEPTETLRNQIIQIIASKNATVGVSIIGNNGKDTLSINGDRHCVLQSVFKFHIAVAVLSEIDKGKLSLDQEVNIKKEEMLPDLWSPLREENPDGGSFTISRLIQYSVSQSDNVACDVLIRLIGTPQTVEHYIKSTGITDISIKINEEVMQAKWENMYQNWTTPRAASEMLRKFYNKDLKLLSETSYNFLWTTMKETSTGLKRLKGLLPDGTVVAHKTGSSGTNVEGLTAATNDIGIVFLPDGQYFIISVFVTDSKENEETNEQIIAEIGKVAYEYFVLKNKS